MSKAVLISIKPKWCELIANGKKTVEVRKTKPSLKPPFKVYIYFTNDRNDLWVLRERFRKFYGDKIASMCNAKDVGGATKENGKVIGEFVCKMITPIAYTTDGLADVVDCDTACVEPLDFLKYGKGKPLYAWHISDLKIYDRPKELSEFRVVYDVSVKTCEFRKITGQPEYKTAHNGWIKGSYICLKSSDTDWCTKCKTKPISKPPQSWCYVEGGAEK